MLTLFANRLESLELGQNDRNGFMLFGSALIHVVLIFGVGFTYFPDRGAERLTPSIATVLVSGGSGEETFEDVELFAQSSQAGGGLGDDERLRSPLPVLFDAATSVPANAARQAPRARSPVERELVLIEAPDAWLSDRAPRRESTAEERPEEPSRREAELAVRVPIVAELDSEPGLGAKRPRQKFISSSTREHKYAAYMEAWRVKTERVGNANYPEVARQRRLSGDVVLAVTVNPDGSIHDIVVIRPSGHKILDDAAVRIVTMAAPFDPFPDEIRAETDLIHITRTWRFQHDSSLIHN